MGGGLDIVCQVVKGRRVRFGLWQKRGWSREEGVVSNRLEVVNVS